LREVSSRSPGSLEVPYPPTVLQFEIDEHEIASR
jgi:hypothetical protein